MQFNISFKTIFEYIRKKFRFVHTNTFCEYRKKLRASPRVHLVYIKIIDNVLLRTIFRGIAAYTPQISCHLCDLVCFGVHVVSVNFLLRKYYNYLNNIDMALLRTSYMYGGFLEYYFRLQCSAFWSMHDKTSS